MAERTEPDPGPGDAHEVSMVELVGVLARRWHVIVGTAVVAGLVTALTVMVAVPREWESTATLVVSRPGFGSDLRPPTLSLQGYQQLLESGAVIAESRARLVEKGALTAAEPLVRGRQLATRIFVSRKSEETSLTPMVFAVARGRSARQAADIANTWAEVFLDKVRDLTAGATSSAIEFINRQYHGSVEAILKLEAGKLEMQASGRRRYDEVADRWDRDIAQQQVASGSNLASHRAETDRLLEEYGSTHGIETRRGRIATLRASLAGLESERGRVGGELARKRLELQAARTTLTATPSMLAERKAISDEALWQVVSASKEGPDWKALSGRVLVSETINPLYGQLSATVALTEIEVNALAPRAAQLSALVEEAATTLREQEIDLAKDVAGMTALTEERQAGLMALLADQGAEAAVLIRDRERELAELKGDQDNALLAIDREIAAHEDVVKSLSKAHVQATLAESQLDSSDVHLAARAMVPSTPVGRRTVGKAAAACVLGGLLGIMLALALEARSRIARA